jgi:hypothetical protein
LLLLLEITVTEPSNRPPDDEPFPDPVTPDGPALHLHLAAPTEISGPAGLAFVDVTFSVPKFWSVFGSVPLTTDDRVPLEENPPPDSNR